MEALFKAGYKFLLPFQPNPGVNQFVFRLFLNGHVEGLLYKNASTVYDQTSTSDSGIIIFGNNNLLEEMIVSL